MYAAIYLFQRILNSFVMQNGFDKTGSNDVVSYDTSEVTKRFFFFITRVVQYIWRGLIRLKQLSMATNLVAVNLFHVFFFGAKDLVSLPLPPQCGFCGYHHRSIQQTNRMYAIYKDKRLKIVKLKCWNQTFSAVCHQPWWWQTAENVWFQHFNFTIFNPLAL